MTTKPGLADPENPLVPFRAFDRLHVARFLIIEADTWRDIEAYGITAHPYPVQLAFVGDVDGDRDSFLDELVEQADEGLRKIFAYCDGFDTGTNLRRWMVRHNVQEAANYVNTRGRTVQQIREEAALCQALGAELARVVEAHGAADATQLHERLAHFVDLEQRAGRLPLTPPERMPLGRKIANGIEMIGVPLGLVLISPLLLLLLPFLLWRLRSLERSDPEILPRPDDAKIVALGAQEDHDVTNPFSAIGDLKPGPFRRATATTFLYLLNYAAKYIYGRGYLTRVQTIHFARWVFLDNKRRVLFCSNYDGALEAYMDDFVNKVAWGLNIVFSNGVGYPSTRYLLKDGASQESKFKRYLRNRQQLNNVWYKAYPGLTARDLARHSEIRAGLETRPNSSRALRLWLSKIRTTAEGTP
ncbi:hypothetical protein [Litoreibacter arenae]|nr:hypothetical protein [Litoreibacter arenae]